MESKLPADQAISQEAEPRGLFVRIIVSMLWFPLVVLAINMFAGGVVGGFAGSGTTGFNEGYLAGVRASTDFFALYGRLLYYFEIIAWLFLCIFGVLPGTSRFKKVRRT